MDRGVDSAVTESRLQLRCKQPLTAQFRKRLVEDLVTLGAESLDVYL
jgi:hypothetical protein